ncbi:MAG TPA: RNA polymerase sigma factor [Burkholderiales bacterium]|nr:RNA polymerase sigma factor [Burkholderiales bacterium]
MSTNAQASITPNAGLPDEELARRGAAGDMLALEMLMRKHNRKLYRAARAVLRDDAEAEDALQVAYLRAFEALGSFRGEAKLSTWLTRIVVNEALMRARRRKREGIVIPLDSATQEVSGDAADAFEGALEAPETAAMRSELRALLERRIDALPDIFRTVFMLRAVEELTVEETAAILDVPEVTVRTRFFRARSLLRESLAREIDVATSDAFGFDGARCDRIVAAVLSRLRPPDST